MIDLESSRERDRPLHIQSLSSRVIAEARESEGPPDTNEFLFTVDTKHLESQSVKRHGRRDGGNNFNTVVENLKVGHYMFGTSAMIGLIMVRVFLCAA